MEARHTCRFCSQPSFPPEIIVESIAAKLNTVRNIASFASTCPYVAECFEANYAKNIISKAASSLSFDREIHCDRFNNNANQNTLKFIKESLCIVRRKILSISKEEMKQRRIDHYYRILLEENSVTLSTLEVIHSQQNLEVLNQHVIEELKDVQEERDAEIMRLREERDTEIARLQEERDVAIAAIQERDAAIQERDAEIARLQEERDVVIQNLALFKQKYAEMLSLINRYQRFGRLYWKEDISSTGNVPRPKHLRTYSQSGEMSCMQKIKTFESLIGKKEPYILFPAESGEIF